MVSLDLLRKLTVIYLRIGLFAKYLNLSTALIQTRIGRLMARLNNRQLQPQCGITLTEEVNV